MRANALTIHTALRQGSKLLEDAGIQSPRLTAEVLLGHATHRRREYFFAHPEQELTELEWLHYGRYLHQRMQGRPTQYITGRQEFYGREFKVDQRALIPRPETEHLIEAVLPLATGAPLILDVGCGSGAIAITLALELPAARVIASDISWPALQLARENAAALGAQVAWLQADLVDAVDSAGIDILVSNPPYVAEESRAELAPEVRDWEPALALFGGAGGFEVTARLLPEAARVLRGGGLLVMEMGAGQWAAHARLAAETFTAVEPVFDLARIPRALKARRR